MSASDVETLLNTPKVFLFLPVVNYVYLIGTTDTNNVFILCIVAAISSAFIYNILDGIPADRAAEVPLGLTITFVVAGLIWLYVLYMSTKTLLDSFYLNSIIHEVLFFITVTFVSIVTSHLFLLGVDEYQNKV
jgi:hypothetical protein